jgi:hypothetical protein
MGDRNVLSPGESKNLLPLITLISFMILTYISKNLILKFDAFVNKPIEKSKNGKL